MGVAMTKVGAWVWKKFSDYIDEEKFRKQGKVGKVWGYYTAVKDLINDRTRSGGFMKLGIQLTMDVAGKALDFSPTSHPYFTYHKAHLKVLADALEAQADSQAATEAYNKAVTAADSTTAVGDILREYKKRTGLLGVQYASFIDALGLLHDLNAGGTAAAAANRTIRQYSLSMDDIHASEENLKAWRANWLGLYFESLQILTMTEVELGTAAESVAQFKQILAKLAKGSNLDKVVGKGTEQNIYWEQYDRMVHPSAKKPEGAVLDPTLYAARKRDDADTATGALADMCSFVITQDVRDKDHYVRQAAALAKVLDAV